MIHFCPCGQAPGRTILRPTCVKIRSPVQPHSANGRKTENQNRAKRDPGFRRKKKKKKGKTQLYMETGGKQGRPRPGRLLPAEPPQAAPPFKKRRKKKNANSIGRPSPLGSVAAVSAPTHPKGAAGGGEAAISGDPLSAHSGKHRCGGWYRNRCRPSNGQSKLLSYQR